MCNSSSSVLVLNRTSPSLLHTFVAYATQLSIAIQHNGNSFLHQHIPRKRLQASPPLNDFVSSCVRFVTCSHGTDCHAELPSGRVQRFKMAKIDPVSPFYPTL